jgi:hypothetical protein
LPKKRLLIGTQALFGVLALTLAATTALHALNVWIVWGVALLTGLASTINTPAVGSLCAEIHKTSEMLGRRPSSGLLLLRDLRQLYLMAEEANIHWLVLGQVAQAVRDESLLDEVSTLHKQVLTQIKWLKTRIKESSPQALVVAD